MTGRVSTNQPNGAQNNVAVEPQEWPSNCRSCDGLTIDPDRIQEILAQDTLYAQTDMQWYLEYIYFSSDGRLQRQSTRAADSHQDGIFHSSLLQSRLTIVHLQQRRLYLRKATTSSISVDRPTWLSLLERFRVIPSFLELLHNNNGGTLSFISHDDSRPSSQVSNAVPSEGRCYPTALHLGYTSWPMDGPRSCNLQPPRA